MASTLGRATISIATDPRTGHETTNLVGWGSNPLGGSRSAARQLLLDVAQKQSAWVTTTMSLVQSQSSRQKIDRFDHTTVPWRDTILRRSMAEVRILSVVLLTSPSGTVLVSKSGEQCSIHWRRALPGPRSGPPCGVTAAGGISGLETRRTFPTCGPAARVLGRDPRGRWCNSNHVDHVIWV